MVAAGRRGPGARRRARHLSTAHADPTSRSAQAQAKALAAQVKSLQVQAEVATEQYDAVQEQLGEVVSRYLTASQNVGSLQQQTDQLQAQRVARARALYMAGGQLGLYAQVLDGTDINDVLEPHLGRRARAGRRRGRDQRGQHRRRRSAQAQADQLDALAAAAHRAAGQGCRRRGPHVLRPARPDQHAAGHAPTRLVRRLIAEEQAQRPPPPRRRWPPSRAARRSRCRRGTAPQIVAAIAAARTRLGAAVRVGGHRAEHLRLLGPDPVGVRRGRGAPAPHLARAVVRRPAPEPGPAAARRPAVLGHQHQPTRARSTTWRCTSATAT